MHACEQKVKGEKDSERRSLMTMDLARNLHPPIPWDDSHHCHDAYEVHAVTLWGIYTCVTFVRTDCTTGVSHPIRQLKEGCTKLTCKSGQRFPLAALRKRSSVHGRTSRRSQICAIHSTLWTATSTRPVGPLGSAPTTPALVPATSYRRPCPPGVRSVSASRYWMTRTTKTAAYA